MLQGAIIAFFTSMIVLLVILYLVAPSIYLETLQLNAQPTDTHPLAVNLFFAAILIFVAMGAYGVLRGWRWVFWVAMLAFLASVLEIPAGILQLVGSFPSSSQHSMCSCAWLPVWSSSRSASGCCVSGGHAASGRGDANWQAAAGFC
jgi:hypothetical protein